MTANATLAPADAPSAIGRPQGAVLAGLWLVWAALLFGGFLLGPTNPDQTNRIPRFNRLASSAVLVVAGAVWWQVARSTQAARYAGCMAAGMTFGFAGDICNAGILGDMGLPDPGVLGGIVTFGIGHVLYMWGAFDFARRMGWRRVHWGAIVAWQVLAVIGWYFAVVRGDEARELVWPALPYSLLLAGTAGVASWLAIEARSMLVFALGGALFLFSDMVLAVRMFHGPYYLAGDACWLTYGPGQMLIVYSCAAAILLLTRPASLRA